MNKAEFLKALETALKTDDRSDLESIDYVRDMDNWPEEAVIITYANGHKVFVNVSGNSNGANALEVVKEVYGEGAQGRFFRYTE